MTDSKTTITTMHGHGLTAGLTITLTGARYWHKRWYMRLLGRIFRWKAKPATFVVTGVTETTMEISDGYEDGGAYCGTIIRSADYATNGVWKRVSETQERQP